MKNYFKIFLLVICSLVLVGCYNENEIKKESNVVNSALAKLDKEVTDNAAGILINYADDELVSKVTGVTTVNLVEFKDERGLLIPYYVGSNVKIYSVEYDPENEYFKRGEVVHEYDVTDGTAIDLGIFRPDVMPMNEIVITNGTKTYSLLLSYNGKDGTPAEEFITLDKE